MIGKGSVAVAMSGGVDSSVTAAVLKEAGYPIFGVTMTICPSAGYHDQEGNTAAGKINNAVEDARKVCQQLGIAHHVLDLSGDFRERVVDYFLKEYERGRTPNPCVVCNLHIKFDRLMKEAFSLGADYLATGHYARIIYNDQRQKYFLQKARDPGKDQTYFLFSLTQDKLKKILFPLGGYLKEEVREKARSLNLEVMEKPESQEICFIEDNDYKGFIKREGKVTFSPGPFLLTSGERIGTHQGLPFYTVGQRKGLGLAVGYPIYVVDIDYSTNAVVVGKREELFAADLYAGEVSCVSGEPLEQQDLTVKIRYRSPEVEAQLTPLAPGRVIISFKEPQRAVTPGQAVVFYRGEQVLGGGIIEERLAF
ncbi:tRNA 2-thiouridine(34) synthase MnmA [Candidatus Contubernalis alkaliaceticus]|uniref:tRNA 2-thiouridine(34) synthase MnmA n=1 Tax=Candidatus Contubernalis alkaliaceticus TaxID=338645 RepID=UPI001F4BFCB1|nr:tRNA 2-thiouridine(34) synthase MnmA [Candidatus Contubernalis alkalaceticus]UNC92595.1 tRNA 2-thiouridine(34) synthase MnmA [Candidatus Contubernalis alkalaceticus]